MPVMRALVPPLAGALVVSAGVAGCLTDDDVAYDGFGGSGTAFYDASPEELVPACASAVEGVSCDTNNTTPLDCEEALTANVDCNAVFECSTTSGDWVSIEPEHAGTCAPAAACPVDYTETNPSGCAIPNAGTLICEYEDGTCGCAPVAEVDAGDAGITDAGITDAGDAGDAGDADADAGTRFEWRCVHPDHDAGCPRKRPRIGAECVRPLSCDYGLCVFEDGARMDCYAGFWTATRSTQCR